MTPVLEGIGIEKGFDGTPVLRGVDLALADGEVTVLLGANGSGKSTFIRCLTGLVAPDAGRVELRGERIDAHRGRPRRRARRRMAMVFQHFNLIENVSVFQNVLNGAMGRTPFGILGVLAPLASVERREQAMACLERVGLADQAARPARTLSGGQQQRVALARALMQEAEILIADEPVASLDPQAGERVMELLVGIAREQRMTVLVSLHQLALAERFGDRMVGLKAGRLAFDSGEREVDRATLDSLYSAGEDVAA